MIKYILETYTTRCDNWGNRDRLARIIRCSDYKTLWVTGDIASISASNIEALHGSTLTHKEVHQCNFNPVNRIEFNYLSKQASEQPSHNGTQFSDLTVLEWNN